MSFYQKHLFFCINQKENNKKCCQDANAFQYCAYAKRRIKELGKAGDGGVRINQAGCLGRCALGPCLVIYPEQVWYTYTSFADIDEIIDRHVLNNEVVPRLIIA